jgi:hypothetical protein
MPLSGYTSTLPTDILLDTGTLYLGAAVYGAFRGGLTFDPGTTWRNVEFDGKVSPVANLDRKVSVNPTISGTCIELGPVDVARVEPGSTVVSAGAWTGSTSYRGKAGQTLYASGDYLANVRAVWERGAGGFVQVRFPVAIISSYNVAGTPGEEAAIALTIEARLDMSVSGAQPSDMPYRIEYLASV